MENINLHQEIPQTREEKKAMYMAMDKGELVDMLLQCQRLLEHSPMLVAIPPDDMSEKDIMEFMEAFANDRELILHGGSKPKIALIESASPPEIHTLTNHREDFTVTKVYESTLAERKPKYPNPRSKRGGKHASYKKK